MDDQYHQYLMAEIRRRLLQEGQERVLKCLDLLTEQEIWYRPNEHSNSVGNLVLHLCGNVRQWLHATLGGEPDIRRRQEEFDSREAKPKEELKTMVKSLMQQSGSILDACTPAMLTRSYRVQGLDETGVAILIHISEHWSYHVGQITYFAKAQKDIDVGYYAGQDLDATS